MLKFSICLVVVSVVCCSAAIEDCGEDEQCQVQEAQSRQGRQLLQTQAQMDQKGDDDLNIAQQGIKDAATAINNALESVSKMADGKPFDKDSFKEQLDRVEAKVDKLEKAGSPSTKGIDERLDRIETKIGELGSASPPPASSSPSPTPSKPSSPSPSPPAPPSSDPTPSSSTGSESSTFSEGAVPKTNTDRFISAHNYWRCIHNTGPVTWNEDIARAAQKWVDDGNTGHAQCYKLPNPIGPTGENIAGGTGLSPEMASAMWHDENPERGPNCGGHCTAMLWKSADQLGCGITEGGRMIRAICRYGGGTPLNRRLAANFGGSSAKQANVKYPDNSRAAECKKKYPPAEGFDHDPSSRGPSSNDGGSGGGGSGGSGGGSPFGRGGFGGWR